MPRELNDNAALRGMDGMTRRPATLIAIVLATAATSFATGPIDIQLAHMTPRELQTKVALEAVLRQYDLSKYTFTDRVIIEQGAVNHSFPEITLNVRFADLPDALLSSYIHEQLHWYLRAHNSQRLEAIDLLSRFYPNAPVEYPEGGGTAVSTYGHLVVCYLEMQADRQLLGQKRTTTVINEIPWYTWIWKTVVQDEPKIAGIVKAEHLDIQ